MIFRAPDAILLSIRLSWRDCLFDLWLAGVDVLAIAFKVPPISLLKALLCYLICVFSFCNLRSLSSNSFCDSVLGMTASTEFVTVSSAFSTSCCERSTLLLTVLVNFEPPSFETKPSMSTVWTASSGRSSITSWRARSAYASSRSSLSSFWFLIALIGIDSNSE